MKPRNKNPLQTLLLLLLALLLTLVGCGDTPQTTESEQAPTTTGSKVTTAPPSSTQSPTTTADPVTPPTPGETGVDLVLFIGQSNMAGRGSAKDATVVKEGHAYEFRAISDPTKLYPITEPFGAKENNAASGVTENKKTGSMVSAFCETYYQATGTPIVAVSCSKGGEKIDFFKVGGAVYNDAVSRVRAAKAFLQKEYENGNEALKLRNTYVVWLQGESDGDAATSASAYTKALDSIVEGFKKDLDAEQTFVIPIGTYNGADGKRRANYNTLRDAQILFCQESSDAAVVSLILPDLHRYSYMKDEFHFNQAGYELIGKDAAQNMATFVTEGKEPKCNRYYEEEVKTSGAFLEEKRRVVINTASALELSPYAAYSSAGSSLTWQQSDTALDGILQANASGNFWEINYAFAEAPQLHYTVNFTETGRYYLYFLASHPDTTSNSVYVSLDSGPLVACTDARDICGDGRWIYNAAWYLDVTETGEHTVTVHVREDGVLLHQLMLSTSKNEAVSDGAEQPVSKRAQAPATECLKETDGDVTVDLVSALQNGKYAYTVKGNANNIAHDFLWERSVAYPGIQVYPDAGVQWATNNISPKASYVIDFSTPGEYYVSITASFKSPSADSVFISVNGGAIVTLSSSVAVGPGKTLQEKTWKITVPYAGEHTIHLYPREDGAILHTLRLVHVDKAEKLAVKTLVIGDSYTTKTSWRHFDRQMSPLSAITVGVGGTETKEWQAGADTLALFDPENIILHIGVNDIDRGKSGEETGANIIKLLEKLKALFPDAKIYYVTVCDNEKFPQKWGEYAISNGIVKEYAATDPQVEIVDFATEMKKQGATMDKMGFRDQLHLSDAGYELFTQMIIDAVTE